MSDYWISHNGGRNNHDVFHTDKDCPSLQQAKDSKPIGQQEIDHYDLDECRFCAGTADFSSSAGNREIYEAALEAGKNE